MKKEVVMEKWELYNRIDKIIDKNCEEIDWEGTYVDKGQLKQDILDLIDELTREE